MNPLRQIKILYRLTSADVAELIGTSTSTVERYLMRPETKSAVKMPFWRMELLRLKLEKREARR